jgi:endonuclease/exonuclease/phosphatase (EEP) superfamily protein YafD
MKITGWLLAGGMAAVAGLRFLPRDYHRAQIAAEGTRDLLLAPAPVLAAIAVARRRPALALAFAALSVELARHADIGRPSAAPQAAANSTDCRLITANVLRWNDQIAQLADDVLRESPDIVVLQELTPDHVAALESTDLWNALPHRILDPIDGFYGSAILSRWPIAGKAILDLQEFPMATADILTPAGEMHVIAVHTVNPAEPGRLPTWRRQHEQLADYVRHHTRPVVLAGDFNATGHHRPFRTLLAADLRDAFTDAGRGTGATWPNRRPPIPSVMRLDHVVFSPGITARAVTSAPSTGSDHRRLIVDLAIEPDHRA